MNYQYESAYGPTNNSEPFPNDRFRVFRFFGHFEVSCFLGNIKSKFFQEKFSESKKPPFLPVSIEFVQRSKYSLYYVSFVIDFNCYLFSFFNISEFFDFLIRNIDHDETIIVCLNKETADLLKNSPIYHDFVIRKYEKTFQSFYKDKFSKKNIKSQKKALCVDSYDFRIKNSDFMYLSYKCICYFAFKMQFYPSNMFSKKFPKVLFFTSEIPKIPNFDENFQILGEFGAGNFSKVNLAVHKKSAQLVACKYFFWNKVNDFKKERKFYKILGNRSDLLLKCYGHSYNGSNKILILDFMANGSLAEIIKYNHKIRKMMKNDKSSIKNENNNAYSKNDNFNSDGSKSDKSNINESNYKMNRKIKLKNSIFLKMKRIDDQNYIKIIKSKNDHQHFLLDGTCRTMTLIRLFKAINILSMEGFMHRDVKDGNIFFNNEREAVLGDFNFATTFVLPNSINLDHKEERSLFLEESIGSIIFASPEQINCQNKNYSFQTDIFSIGKIIYILCKFKYPCSQYNHNEVIEHDIFKLKKGKMQRLFSTCTGRDPCYRISTTYLLYYIKKFKIYFKNTEEKVVDEFFQKYFAEIDTIIAKENGTANNIVETIKNEEINQEFLTKEGKEFEEKLYKSDMPMRKDVQIIYREAIDNNNPIASFYIGMFYYIGVDIKKDIRKSFYFFKKSNCPSSKFYLGNMYYSGVKNFINKNNETAFKYVKEYVDNNNEENDIVSIDGINLLAEMYLKEIGCKKNVVEAMKLLQRGVNINSGDSAYMLGQIYFSEKKPADEVKAYWYWKYAAKDLNNKFAQNKMAVIKLHGSLKKRVNIKKAMRYLKMSVKLQEIPYNVSCFDLGLIYLTPKYNHYKPLKGIAYLKLGAHFNNIKCCLILGDIYYGIREFTISNEKLYIFGITQDLIAAVKYFEKASNLESIDGMYKLAILYHLRRPNQNKYDDYRKSYKLYKKLANKYNYPDAMYNLSGNLASGTGCKKNFEKAVEYCKRAANCGCSIAQYFIGVYYEKYCLDKQNKALKFYSLSKERDAYYMMGRIYYFGLLGCERNHTKSLDYFYQACCTSNQLVFNNLGNCPQPLSGYHLAQRIYHAWLITKDMNKIGNVVIENEREWSTIHRFLGLKFYETKCLPINSDFYVGLIEDFTEINNKKIKIDPNLMKENILNVIKSGNIADNLSDVQFLYGSYLISNNFENNEKENKEGIKYISIAAKHGLEKAEKYLSTH